MADTVEGILQAQAAKNADQRFQIFEVRIVEQDAGRVVLSGRVLNSEDLQNLRYALQAALPGLQVDDTNVRVLRGSQVQILSSATNLTGLYHDTDKMSELMDQMLPGKRLEVLEEVEGWAHVRQVSDGYIGWAVRPYLTAEEPLPATHLVTAPAGRLLNRPEGQLIGRVMCGTPLAVLDRKGSWARVSVFEQEQPANPSQIHPGWLPLDALRPLSQLPQTEAERRACMMADAFTLLGVPYLWGGCTANGIDCSGFAQLLHRWVGIDIPRDGGCQFEAGRVVEPPFEAGDLLFFGEGGDDPRITHVTVSTGGWNIIHSSGRHNGVYCDNVQEVESLRESYLCACTYIR